MFLPSFGDSTTNLQSIIPVEKSSKAESETQVKSLSTNNCKPKHNILFLKTHKTGSSTLQNIFFRYGDEHNLTFVLPKTNIYFGHPEPFNHRMVYLHPMPVQDPKALSSNRNNIFANHARYNYEEMKFIMPVDTIFVTILREPVSLIESLFSYCNLKKDYGINSTVEFLDKLFSTSPNMSFNLSSYHTRFKGRVGTNQMSFDLGLDVKDFDNLDMIKSFIKTIDSQFHLVMILDRIEESLILLQHLLCWTLDDVIVFRHNVRNMDFSHNLSIALKEKIRFANKADELLYKYFSDKLTLQIEAFGKTEMQKQIICLRHETKLMYDKCVEKEVPMKDLESSKNFWYNEFVSGFKLKENAEKKCHDLTTSEVRYTALLRKKQGLRNGTSEVYTPVQ